MLKIFCPCRRPCREYVLNVACYFAGILYIFFFVCHGGMLGWVLKTSEHRLGRFFLRFLQGWSLLLARFSTNCEQHGPTKKLILVRILPRQPQFWGPDWIAGQGDGRRFSYLFSSLLPANISEIEAQKKSGKHPSLRIPQKCAFEFHRWYHADSGNKTCG